MKKSQIDQIFQIFSKQNPYPKTELIFKNNYTLLVAVVLSAQSTDIGVNKATKKLFEVADNPEKMVAIGEDDLKTYINTIGLFNGKAKNVIALSKKLIEKFNSQIPENLEDLESLAGVGRKTANVVMNCAFGAPTIGVDTHVFRVSNRIGIVKEKDVLKTEISLLKKIPKEWKQHAHHWLILHGRYVCVARKPKCEICLISDFCISYPKLSKK
ncbi:MAG: endonuclease-3 [Rickettsiales bacterium]|jgi:endonuclease-3